MTIRDFKTLFSDYNRGPVSFIHMLSNPIAAARDTALLQEDIDQLKEAIAKSEKNTSTKLAFYGSHHLDKAMQLNHIAYHTKQSVCFVDCQRLLDKYIGETEKHLSKLIAQAESENWILFFDEADALFGRRSKVNETHDQYANQEVSYLFKRLSQYPGLSILSLSEKSKLENVRYLIDGVITFR
ncbi:AAA family ATPase [uncultured Paraglaciecola sp.]|uniref:AAA family ATPase n=1 Tax=uncultured Paraglaciecola sp. TaxID=1765024 RepID=UPI0025E5EDE6|nr:AAA family ATPase [uncultured Paraglaciecola sp.]